MSTLTTIAVCWIAASYLIAIAIPAHAMRHAPDEWQAAGRDRRFWVTLTLIFGFHGLGQYAAVAYLVGVRPRLRAVAHARQPRAAGAGAITDRWQRTVRVRAGRGWQHASASSKVQELVILAAVLVLASSLIHAAMIAPHFDEYWLFGTCFALAAVGQALWVARVYSDRLNRRLLLAGAAGNAALVVVWALSRTVGMPLGPRPWQAEAVSWVDVLSTLDELSAVILVGVALKMMDTGRSAISPVLLRLAVGLTGVLFLYSVLSPFAGGHHHPS
ncbi:MAG: hypothetical protein QOJ89_1499 [bacterium]|jgi:hypothetical protein